VGLDKADSFFDEGLDFGAGANLFQMPIGGRTADVLGAGFKTGSYLLIGLDTPDASGDGSPAWLWRKNHGPGGFFGGYHWGTAVGEHIYGALNNTFLLP